MEKLMIIMDIDGVLANLEGRLVEHLVSRYGKDAGINRDMYALEDRYADFPEILDAALSFVIDPNSYYPLEPMMDGLVFVEKAIANGYPVQFLSSRPKGAETFTVRWLRKHLLNYDETLGAKCLDGNKARTILKDYKDLVAFVVEDRPDTVAKLNEGGILAYSWAQPWNTGVYPAILHDDEKFLIASSAGAKTEDFWEKWA
jgi:hypothetical protein